MRQPEIPDDEIPDVDPFAPGLDDLFAWGDAIARCANLTPEKSRAILRAVRRSPELRRLGDEAWGLLKRDDGKAGEAFEKAWQDLYERGKTILDRVLLAEGLE